MAIKMPWMKFYPKDWLGDPQLSQCKPSTRGIWMDAVSAMHANGRTGQLEGEIEALTRICRCTPDELMAACRELKATKTAEIRIANAKITLENRRMKREENARQQSRNRGVVFRKRQKNAPETPKKRGRSQKPEARSQKPEKKETFNPLKVELPAGIDTELWANWVQHRIEIKKPLTSRAVSEQLKYLAESTDANGILKNSVRQGYQGLYPPGKQSDAVNSMSPQPIDYEALSAKTQQDLADQDAGRK